MIAIINYYIQYTNNGNNIYVEYNNILYIILYFVCNVYIYLHSYYLYLYIYIYIVIICYIIQVQNY